MSDKFERAHDAFVTANQARLAGIYKEFSAAYQDYQIDTDSNPGERDFLDTCRTAWLRAADAATVARMAEDAQRGREMLRANHAAVGRDYDAEVAAHRAERAEFAASNVAGEVAT